MSDHEIATRLQIQFDSTFLRSEKLVPGVRKIVKMLNLAQCCRGNVVLVLDKVL